MIFCQYPFELVMCLVSFLGCQSFWAYLNKKHLVTPYHGILLACIGPLVDCFKLSSCSSIEFFSIFFIHRSFGSFFFMIDIWDAFLYYCLLNLPCKEFLFCKLVATISYFVQPTTFFYVSSCALQILFILLQVPSHEVFHSLNATIVGLARSSKNSEVLESSLPWCVGLGISDILI